MIFMSSEDERAFSEMLKAKFPAMIFLDDNVWPTPEPVTAPSIEECKSRHRQVCLWNKRLFPLLPVGPRPGGQFQAPNSGPVAQFLRSIAEGNVLRAGRIAVGLDEEDLKPEVRQYLNDLWKLVKEPATSTLICVDPGSGELINPKVRGYWAWPDAVRWCQSDKGHFFRDRATQNFFLPG